MKFKLEERQALFNQKITGGKTFMDANKEIARDEEHLFNSNRDIKMLQQTVKRLNLELKWKTQEVRSLRKKMLDKDLRKQSTSTAIPRRSHKIVSANVTHLNRILSLLDNESICATKLANECLLDKRQIMSGLMFLEHHKIISKNAVGKYFLNK